MADDRVFKHVKRLANEGLKTLDFFHALQPEDWHAQVYTAGSGWTVIQILCHLLNAEQGFHHLLQDVMHGGEGAPEYMDIDVFNEQQLSGTHCTDAEIQLAAFSDARVTTIEIVRTMHADDLDKLGRHPFLGPTTVDKMVQLIYRHSMLHQRDIRRALDRGEPVDSGQ